MKNMDLVELYLQLISLYIIQKDYNNTDLMNELQHQDRNYLEKIVEQNKQILEILKERR
jgi:hypothetical protein